jgi:hypothetical protein
MGWRGMLVSKELCIKVKNKFRFDRGVVINRLIRISVSSVFLGNEFNAVWQ